MTDVGAVGARSAEASGAGKTQGIIPSELGGARGHLLGRGQELVAAIYELAPSMKQGLIPSEVENYHLRGAFLRVFARCT